MLIWPMALFTELVKGGSSDFMKRAEPIKRAELVF